MHFILKTMIALNIFTKCPYQGNPKKRLSDILTPNERIFISKKMLMNILDEVKDIEDIRIYIWVYPNYNHSFFFGLKKKYKIILKKQIGSSLLDRMNNCNKKQLRHYSKSILIGSDLPTFFSGIIRECINSLETKDCVIGPSKDGGFYLLGIKNSNNLLKNLFGDELTYKSLKEIVETNNLTYSVTHTLKDIDTKEDLLSI